MRHSKPFLLTKSGSDRGSAYAFSNKSVTVGETTFVTWTDAIAKTMVRSYDHNAGAWSDAVEIGVGCDNHNTPSLTADPSGRLMVAYGPHGTYQPYFDDFARGVFKFAVADHPGEIDGLDRVLCGFGEASTYASLACTKDFAAIAYRGGESPWHVMFQRAAPPYEQWGKPMSLMAQDVAPGYVHYGAIIAAAADGTLYVAAHFYARERDHSLGVAVLKSTDGGETWLDLAGVPVQRPARYGDRIAAPHAPAEHDPRVYGLEVDQQGRPWVLSSDTSDASRAVHLGCWERGAGWRMLELSRYLPKSLTPYDGGLCVDAGGRVHVVLCARELESLDLSDPKQRWWSHCRLEVVHLWSDNDGRSFEFAPLSPPDPAVPNWLPNISRSSPLHPVAKPLVLYTHGETGQHTNPDNPCRPDIKTEVYAVFIEP